MCEVAWDIIIDAPRCEITPQFYIYSLCLLFHDAGEVGRNATKGTRASQRIGRHVVSIAMSRNIAARYARSAIIGQTIVLRVRSQLSRSTRNSSLARSEESIGLGFDELKHNWTTRVINFSNSFLALSA